MSRLISIIGDANVRRNMTGLNVGSREAMKNAQVINYAAPAPFDQVLKEVRADAEVCIIAALTDLLLVGGDSGTIYASIDPILTSFRTKVFNYCDSHPNQQVILLNLLFSFSCFLEILL